MYCVLTKFTKVVSALDTEFDTAELFTYVEFTWFSWFNPNALLTHLAYHDGPRYKPVLMDWNKHTILGRARVLLNLSEEYDKRLTSTIRRFMDEMDLKDTYVKGLAMDVAQTISSYKSMHHISRQIYDRIEHLKSIGIIMPYERVKRIEESLK